MPRIQNKHLKIFASDASNNGVFGSAADNTKILSNDVETLQSKPAWEEGWEEAVIGTRKFPTLEEFQSCNYINTHMIAYILQEGIPEWNAQKTYYQNSIVKKSGTYEIYGSLIDDNTGNNLPNAVSDSNWEFLQDLSLDYGIPYGVSTNSGNNYSVTTSPVFTTFTDGMPVFVKINAQNTGAATINPNSTSPKNILMDGVAMVGGEMRANTVYLLIYDSVADAFHLNGGHPVYANDAETQAGLITSKAVTPAGLASVTSTETRRGLIELATSAEVIAGLDSDRAITPATLKSAIGITKFYNSGNLTWSYGTLGQQNHGLGATPIQAIFRFVCVSAEGGYSVGDVIPWVNDIIPSGGMRTAGFNSTQVFWRIGYAGNPRTAFMRKDASSFFLTPSSWRLQIMAWA